MKLSNKQMKRIAKTIKGQDKEVRKYLKNTIGPMVDTLSDISDDYLTERGSELLTTAYLALAEFDTTMFNHPEEILREY